MLYTPHLANLNLWKTSGHNDFYRSDMFSPIAVEDHSEQHYQIKPMNCPFHCLLYKDTPKSYRDLPIRWAELGTVYRYEKHGTLHGLFRVRGFTQDDAHIFCLPEQLTEEILQVLHLVEKVLKKFGFLKYEVMLSTRPSESVGSDEIWKNATTALQQALEKKGWKYNVDDGCGAFYGPKIDIKIHDAIGRKWQCSTIQCDFNLPERFDLEYTPSTITASSAVSVNETTAVSATSDSTVASPASSSLPSSTLKHKPRPIMIHRAIFGSLERFFGILIENTKGEFPFWLSPIQLRLVPVIDEVLPYCEEIKRLFLSSSKNALRIEIDTSGNRLAKAIRNAADEKIPFIGIIGKNEMNEKSIVLRINRGGMGDIGSYKVNELLIKKFLALNNDEMELKKESFEDLVMSDKKNE
jgi:threonyl-tRNA synthetase